MKPSKFAYHAPASVDEALELLRKYDGEARLLAGGQSLLPMMNFRLIAPAALIDLNRIEALSYVREEHGTIRIGAMVRHRQLECSPVVRAKLPLLAEALGLVAHVPIRTRGTIGGSLANADPSAEISMVVRALDGQLIARGPAGERIIDAKDFFVGLLTTALAPDEILTEVRLPVMPATAGYAVEEYSRRKGDFAIAAVTAVIADVGKGALVRLAAVGVMPTPIRLDAAEKLLEDRGVSSATIKEASKVAAHRVESMSDQHASAEYRRHLLGVLTERSLHRAASLQERGRS